MIFYRNLLINWVFLSWRQVQRVPPMWNKHLWPWQLKSRGEWVHPHLLLMHLGKGRSLIQVHLLRRKVVVVVKSFLKKTSMNSVACIHFSTVGEIQALWLQFTGGRWIKKKSIYQDIWFTLNRHCFGTFVSPSFFPHCFFKNI